MVRGGVAARWLSGAGFYALAVLFMLPTVFVFYWMITLSLKPQVEATAYPPSFFHFSVTLAGYREVFTKYPFLLYTWNSLVVAVGSTALGLAVGLPAAYSIARWRQQRLALTILVARIIPGIAYLIPWYIFFRRLRMVDTYGALILTHLIVSLPIIIWVMISFFEDVPSELEDAALIDGCGPVGAMWRVMLPVAIPGLITTALFTFFASWNEFFAALILISDQAKFTLPVTLTLISSGTFGSINWGLLQAGVALTIVPCIVIYLLLQRYYVGGLLSGALK